MPGFIDTHCHIIPAVDDGSPDEQTSIEMGMIAAADGISTIVATPHITEGVYDGSDRDEQISRLKQRFGENDIDIQLVPGAEVPMSACISAKREALEKLAIGGGSYLLVETGEATPEQMGQAAYSVRLAGLYPVFAHPERTLLAQRHPDRLAEIISRNEAWVQVTVASIDGLFGKPAKKTWEQMAKAGLVHLIGSDAHSGRVRAPRLSGSYRQLSNLVGEKAAGVIMLENPQQLLAGEKMRSPEAFVRPSGGSIWSRLRR